MEISLNKKVKSVLDKYGKRKCIEALNKFNEGVEYYFIVDEIGLNNVSRKDKKILGLRLVLAGRYVKYGFFRDISDSKLKNIIN